MNARRRKHPLTAGVLVVMLVAGAAGFVLAAGTAQVQPVNVVVFARFAGASDETPTKPRK